MKPQRRSSKCSIVNRTVSFNVEDPYQRGLLEKSQQFTNFSAAVKRWLGGEQTAPTLFEAQHTAPSHELAREEFDPVSALF